jgi:hypothetical protein
MQKMGEKTDWQSIRRCVELGVPPKSAAEKFGVGYDALRQRACREKWLTPARLDAIRSAQAPAPAPATMSQAPAPASQSDSSPVALSLVTDTIASMGAELKTITLQKTLAAIKRADLASLPIDSWSDAKTAFEVGLKAAGLDQQAGPSVSVIVSGTPDNAPLIEIDAAPAPELL